MNLRKFAVSGVALTALAACELPPEGTSENDVAFFDEAVTSINCRIVDEGDMAAVEFQTGLNRQQIMDILGFKVRTEDMVQLPDGGYRLTTGECAADA